jgi:hypothetical protein
VDAVLAQDLGGAQAGVQGDAGTDEGHVVLVGTTQQFGTADGEGLPVRIEDRVAAAGGAQVADPLGGGHRLDQRGSAGGVTGIEHGRAMHRAHHREVFQAHLGGAVGADLDTGVRAHQAQIDTGDGAHPDEVIRPGPKGGERRGERPVAAHGQAGGGGHQLLLGDEHLEIPLRVGARELPSERGVADFPIQRHDLRIPGAQGDERIAPDEWAARLGTISYEVVCAIGARVARRYR